MLHEPAEKCFRSASLVCESSNLILFTNSGKRLMNQANTVTPESVGYLSNTQIRQQLMREISCLERQLSRLTTSGYMKDQGTLQTYKDMIASRQKLLTDLSWSSEHIRLLSNPANLTHLRRKLVVISKIRYCDRWSCRSNVLLQPPLPLL